MIFIETDIQKNTDDIHALTKAFFPGEEIRITLCDGMSDGIEHPVIKPENCGKVGKIVYKSDMGAMFETDIPTDSKDELKRSLYRALSLYTDRILPWGSLTGIRPTRLVRKRIEAGMNDDEILADMKNSYYTSDEKTLLSIEIAKKELALLKELYGEPSDLLSERCHSDISRDELEADTGLTRTGLHYSLYVDIPFCPTRCLYCSFTSNAVGRDRSRVLAYLDALEAEIRASAELMRGRVLDTVYIGGGTPTALLPDELDRLLMALREAFDVDSSGEFTVEAGRPDSIDKDKLLVLKEHGVTRISVNPQTMNQRTLDIIGRRHTVEQVREAYYLAREMGFDNINMDMILGLPGESVEDVKNTVNELCKLNPDSLTIHTLAVKRASVLKEMLEGRDASDLQGSRGNSEAVNGERDADIHREVIEAENAKRKSVSSEYLNDAIERMMTVATMGARSLGMSPYYLYRQKNMSGNLENTGYAKEGKYGLYNILINEEVQDILALGAGAISKRVDENGNTKRSANFKEVHDYISNIDKVIDKKKVLWI